MIEIIYADSDIIVINKPPGMPVHAGGSVSGKTAVDFLLEKFPELRGVGEDSLRPGIVHRLDKDTSGVMAVARNQKSFAALKELFQKRLVEKTYIAVVCGIPKRSKGVISFPIGRLARNPTKRGAVVGDRICAKSGLRGAREAATEYRVLKASEKFSLVELYPKTGRMHQLRVHLKAIGHPVACDKKYGGKKVCCPPGANRQLLHAKSLSFSFPEGRKLYFEADPPSDFSLAEHSVF